MDELGSMHFFECTHVHGGTSQFAELFRRIHPDLIHGRVHSGTLGSPVVFTAVAATACFT
jgi:hypothetical protein